MAATAFEDIVIQALGRLEGKVNELTEEMAQIKNQWEVEHARRSRLEGPLSEWTLQDSVVFKSLLDREKTRLSGAAEKATSQEKSDKRASRLKERLLIAGASIALFQSSLNIHVSSVMHWIMTGGH